MRYPIMSRGSRYSVSIPDLNGGTNKKDIQSKIADNQISDGVNMWYQNGTLQTRPGLRTLETNSISYRDGRSGFFTSQNKVSEREAFLSETWISESGHEMSVSCYEFSLENGMNPLGGYYVTNASWDPAYIDPPSVLGIKATNDSNILYYVLTSDGEIKKSYYDTSIGRYLLSDVDPYIPTVMINGKAVDATGAESAGTANGKMFEAYNMLSGKAKCSYTIEGNVISKRYYLPDLGNNVLSTSVCPKIEITLASGLKTIQTIYTSDDNRYKGGISIPASDVGVTSQETVILQFFIYRETGCIYIFVHDNATDHNVLESNIEPINTNNMTVTICRADSSVSESRETICSMTQCTWFGGDRSGINGGTRLFVCGNAKKPNLIHWSDVNKPLYFPENNYAYIGDSDQKITGFGKQADMLVIFKEHEIYYSQYVAGTVTADDLESGSIEAVIAKFPISPLHPNIGCDCPNTIRLVNNKLVWATTDGHVYSLTSSNQWSERNVRLLSTLIEPITVTSNSHAAEYKGHYIIISNQTYYIMDADNSAYNAFAYYASEQKARAMIPWYIWKMPQEGSSVVSAVSDGYMVKIVVQTVLGQTTPNEYYIRDLYGTKDGDDDISYSVTTKLYDMGSIDRKKEIDQIYIGLSIDGNVKIDYITDKFISNDAYSMRGNSTAIRRISPNINRVSKFGLRLHGTGKISISELQIKYAYQGGVR